MPIAVRHDDAISVGERKRETLGVALSSLQESFESVQQEIQGELVLVVAILTDDRTFLFGPCFAIGVGDELAAWMIVKEFKPGLIVSASIGA